LSINWLYCIALSMTWNSVAASKPFSRRPDNL
jgi:hypothetical protein